MWRQYELSSSSTYSRIISSGLRDFWSVTRPTGWARIAACWKRDRGCSTGARTCSAWNNRSSRFARWLEFASCKRASWTRFTSFLASSVSDRFELRAPARFGEMLLSAPIQVDLDAFLGDVAVHPVPPYARLGRVGRILEAARGPCMTAAL